ncbi:MAG: type I methionyl aminopeptidase [Bacteroidetes bacterium]|nr:MAG: type I methionyl aminopeptidase [Bacteroidota bacterium]
MIHIKSHIEIEKLRASADLVSRSLAEVAKVIGPGVSTSELDRIAEEFILDHGAQPAFKGYGSEPNIFPATLCTSINDVVVHGIPDDEPLQEGDVVSVDCGVILDGYYGDSAYTFCVGDVSEEVAALCSTTYDSLILGVDAATSGKRIGDIGWAVQSVCERKGYGVVRALVGHGIGRDLHEDPQVPNYGRAGTGRKLKSGLAICIEPMINAGKADVFTDKDGWTVRTSDGKPSAHYEMMVIVQPGSADVLTSFAPIEAVLEYIPYNLTADIDHG